MIYYRVYNRFRNQINYFRGDNPLQFFNINTCEFQQTVAYLDIEKFIDSFEGDMMTYEEITEEEFNKYLLASKLSK